MVKISPSMLDFFSLKDGTQLEVGQSESGELQISELDHSNLPGCANHSHEGLPHSHAETFSHAEADTSSEGSLPEGVSAADGNTTIDLLIVYSNEAITAAGGEAALNAKVASAISAANTAYTNSEVNIQLNLVHSAALNSSESGNFETDLNRLTTTNDGFWDNVHDLRDTYGADLVAMINANNAYCGLGWIGRPNAAYQVYGFSVTNQICLGSQTLAHELGHNMGSMHNPEVVSGGAQGAYSYSFGNHFGSYRTIMAYAPGTRASYFSNPDVSFDGSVTGTADRNNALSLNNMAATISGYRDSVGGPPEATYEVGGTVSLTGGSPLASVSISSSVLGSASTNSSGNYSYSGISDGASYQLTPILSGYSFSPASISGSVSSSNNTHNFTASRTPSIRSIADQNIEAFPTTTAINLTASDTEGDALSYTAEISGTYDSIPASLAMFWFTKSQSLRAQAFLELFEFLSE